MIVTKKELQLTCLHPAPFQTVLADNRVQNYCADCKSEWITNPKKEIVLRAEPTEFTFN